MKKTIQLLDTDQFNRFLKKSNGEVRVSGLVHVGLGMFLDEWGRLYTLEILPSGERHLVAH